VRLLAPEREAALLCGPDGVDGVLPWEGPEVASLLGGASPQVRLAEALDTADAVVAFTRSEPLLEALAARARRLVGHDPTPPPGGPHASVWLASGLAPLGVVPRRDPPPLVFTGAERREAAEHARTLPERFLAVHPGSGSLAKNWPVDRFVATAQELSEGRPWLLVAGPAEAALPPAAGGLVAHNWPLRRLGALVSGAALFIGNDAGVSHLAAAAGAPTLALYGPTDPALWSPVGPSVATLRPSSHEIRDLGTDAVIEAARALRSAASGPRAG
jgi:ADP-heptose:LPS heptosyltransferase